MRKSLWGFQSGSSGLQAGSWAAPAIFFSMGIGLCLTSFLVARHSVAAPMLSAGRSAASSAQVQGMAGYVLNSETNMNTVYTRKLNRELMNPPNSSLDDGPLIQYVGPPPQPPVNGPLTLPLPTLKPSLP